MGIYLHLFRNSIFIYLPKLHESICSHKDLSVIKSNGPLIHATGWTHLKIAVQVWLLPSLWSMSMRESAGTESRLPETGVGGEGGVRAKASTLLILAVVSWFYTPIKAIELSTLNLCSLPFVNYAEIKLLNFW